MSKPYDATTKDLIEADPAGWVTFFGCASADAEDATATPAARVIRVKAEKRDRVMRRTDGWDDVRARNSSAADGPLGRDAASLPRLAS